MLISKFAASLWIGICASLVANAVFADGITVIRLQTRVSDNETHAFTESVYHQFQNQLYFLQLYDVEIDNKYLHHRNERFELNIGRPFIELPDMKYLGWVARAQKWSGFNPIYAAGIQWDLNTIETLSSPLRKMGLKTFIQVFAKNEGRQLGEFEILQYYHLKSSWLSPIELRGNNVYYYLSNDSIVNLWVDIIYPVKKSFDVYARWNYLNINNQQIGDKGDAVSLGFRINL